ncbi:MAG: cation-translocating P-type ATPase [Parcubacteria group bacterium]|jgi:Ca2+-transporting ATPase
MEKKIYNLSPEEALEKFNSGFSGISKEEAKLRRKTCGLNLLKNSDKFKWLKILGGQFNDALIWILLVASLLAFLFGEQRDVTIILTIVLINAGIGFFQEFKAEKIIDKIKKFSSDKAIVLRDGKKEEVDSKFIVPGDVICVSAGDSIAADGYILESFSLKINSFVFTGESKPKSKKSGIIGEKDIPVSNVDNMLFSGESVAVGEAAFLVTGIGKDTELGKIATLTTKVKDLPTPLQNKMRSLGRIITVLSVFIGIMVMIAGQYFHMSLYKNFLFALALAVSVVPEGLPAAISVALSLGMKNLLKKNVLAKRLSAVETLGSVGIICTDKTGTITRNELTVTRIVIDEKVIDVSGNGYEPKGDFYIGSQKINPLEMKNLELIFRIGTLCNNASLQKNENGYAIIGDPTEGAIIVAGKKYNNQEGFFEKDEKRITENPFSSERMMMSEVYKNSNVVSYVKGSPDVVLDLCDKISINGKTAKITEENKKEIRKKYNEMSGEALRVLAFAYKDLSDMEKEDYNSESAFAKAIADKSEQKLIWVGMMGMIDSPRAGVSEAIQRCVNMGIRVMMITGDYEVTAEAIAKKAGIVQEGEEYEVISGKKLMVMSDEEIYAKTKKKKIIFARIAPEQKLQIASILKSKGEIVAMTGDGVNDAPALKKADIGVAMGIMGTDVSKEASDMILLDDNFSSIVNGITEGRTIFRNLKKFVHYILTSNASELFTVVIGVIMQIPSPITAIQILAVDLGTDIFPSFSLSMEPDEPGISRKKKKENVINFKGFRRIVYIGIIMALGAVVAFLLSMMRGGWSFGKEIAEGALYAKSTSAAYAVLSMSQMANLLQSRSESLSVFKLGFFKNKFAIFSIFISLGILLSFMYLPFFQKYLGMVPIGWQDWTVVAISAVAVFLFEEARKGESK